MKSSSMLYCRQPWLFYKLYLFYNKNTLINWVSALHKVEVILFYLYIYWIETLGQILFWFSEIIKIQIRIESGPVWICCVFTTDRGNKGCLILNCTSYTYFIGNTTFYQFYQFSKMNLSLFHYRILILYHFHPTSSHSGVLVYITRD